MSSPPRGSTTLVALHQSLLLTTTAAAAAALTRNATTSAGRAPRTPDSRSHGMGRGTPFTAALRFRSATASFAARRPSALSSFEFLFSDAPLGDAAAPLAAFGPAAAPAPAAPAVAPMLPFAALAAR